MAGTTTCGSHLDGLYILAQQNVADAKLNLCGTSYTLGGYPIATFTSYQGFHGFTLGKALIQLDRSDGSTNFVQNSASVGIWAYAATAEGVGQLGSDGTTVIFDNLSGTFYARVNEPSAAGVPVPGSKGLFVGDRSSSANVVPYWNGISQGPVASVSGAALTNNFNVGYAYGASTQTLCEAHIGGSLGPTLNLALYNRLRTYMTAVGVP